MSPKILGYLVNRVHVGVDDQREPIRLSETLLHADEDVEQAQGYQDACKDAFLFRIGRLQHQRQQPRDPVGFYVNDRSADPLQIGRIQAESRDCEDIKHQSGRLSAALVK